jgi:hypothetical protein
MDGLLGKNHEPTGKNEEKSTWIVHTLWAAGFADVKRDKCFQRRDDRFLSVEIKCCGHKPVREQQDKQVLINSGLGWRCTRTIIWYCETGQPTPVRPPVLVSAPFWVASVP